MGVAYNNLMPAIPVPRSASFPNWVNQYARKRLHPLMQGKKRATTYYVDFTRPNDAGDGLTPETAFKTLNKVNEVLVASNGNVRFRFKRGCIWREYGANTQWTISDDGHWAAIYCNKSNVTFDTYGSPSANAPRFYVGDDMVPIAADYVQSGNAWGTSTSGFLGTTDYVVEDGDELVPYSRQSSLANCQATARSFYFDSGSTTLYIHTDGSNPNTKAFTCIPRNRIDCFRLEGDDNILALGGGWFIGWGLDATDTNSHAYAVSVGQTGTNSVIVADIYVYYGSAHLFAAWHPSGSGGIYTLVRCKGGLNQALLGCRLFNFYRPFGLGELFAYQCEVTHNALDGEIPFCIHGHTDQEDTLDHNFILCLECIGACTSSGTISAGSVAGDYSACRCFAVNCRIGSQGTPLYKFTTGANFCFIGCETWARSSAGNQQLTVVHPTALYLNSVIGVANLDFSGNNGFALHNLTTGALTDLTARFEHCHFVLSNSLSTRGVGIQFQEFNTASLGIATNMVAYRCIWEGVTDAPTSHLCVPAIGNTDTNQNQCDYWQMYAPGPAARPMGGYAAVTTAVELNQQPDVTGVTINSQLVRAITSEALEYDRNFYVRNLTGTNTVGPYEHSSVRGALVVTSTPAFLGLAA